MAHTTIVPLDRFISERRLAQFLREVINDEARLGRSVPGPDCHDLLKTRVMGGLSVSGLHRLLKRLVVEGFLLEDRKGMHVHLVGYFATSQASQLVQKHFDEPEISEETLNLPVATIRKIADAREAAKASVPIQNPSRSSSMKMVEVVEQVDENEQLLAEAHANLNDARLSLKGVSKRLLMMKNDLEMKEKRRMTLNLESIVRASDSVVNKLRMQVTILQRREQEEEARLARAEAHLISLTHSLTSENVRPTGQEN
jgi:hypothetical protein